MSKTKISFSLFFAILLVGILSTAAFAASGPSVKAFQAGQSVAIVLTNATANTTYYADVNVAGTDLPDTSFTTDSTGFATVYVTLTSAQLSGQSVTVTIYQDSNNTTKLAINNPYNPNPTEAFTTYVVQDDNSTAVSDAFNHTINNNNSHGLTNSNQTGQVIGTSANHTNQTTPVKQQMHGFYQNNTNSCASCHQAHTAAVGARNDALLFKDGVYSTCSACHDGTTGGDNNFKAPTASTVQSVDGTFGVVQVDATTGVNENGSMHQADGSLQVSAAPGGGGSQSSSAKSSSTTYSATWGSEFDCASCHNPHGGGTMGENNLNEDPLGWGKINYVSAHANGTADQQNGKLFTKRNIYTSVPQTWADGNYDTYILVKTTAGAVNSNLATTNNTTNGKLYGLAGITDPTTPVIQTYRWNGSSYVPDYSLWLRDTGYEAAPFTKSNTVLYDGTTGTGNDITNTSITPVWANGFAYGSGVASVQSYSLSVGINVEGSSSDAAAYYDNTDPSYIPYSGTEMSLFCSSCHTDYLSAGATDNTGVYTTAHRHRTDEDSLSCVRCHYAHGSDAQIMSDANNNSFWNLSTTNPDGTANTAAGKSPNGTAVNTMSAAAALQYLADPNPSSALKRYTGMSACYGCHGSGDQFMGNPNTTVDSTTGQGVFAGHAGDAGTSGTLGGSRPNNATRH